MIRFADPLRRKIPSTSVAIGVDSDISRVLHLTGGREYTREHTLFLQKHPTFCDNDGNITVDETFTVIICEGDGDIGVFDADVERDTEDALDLVCPPGRVSIYTACETPDGRYEQSSQHVSQVTRQHRTTSMDSRKHPAGRERYHDHLSHWEVAVSPPNRRTGNDGSEGIRRMEDRYGERTFGFFSPGIPSELPPPGNQVSSGGRRESDGRMGGGGRGRRAGLERLGASVGRTRHGQERLGWSRQ